MNGKRKANWELVKNICTELLTVNNGVRFEEVEQIFIDRYPDRKRINVSMEMRMLTVNSQSRLSYLNLNGYIGAKGSKIYKVTRESPRISSPKNPKDVLFHDTSNDIYLKYNPAEHGIFEIKLDNENRNYIEKINDQNGSYFIFQKLIECAAELDEQVLNEKVKESQSLTPRTTEVRVTQYQRSPYIVAKRLKLAAGRCEICLNRAPFKRRTDNTPYLEVHHITSLANGGADTLENTQALCPNCHRKAHFG